MKAKNMTLSISLTSQMENIVRAKIDSGMYSSANEVLNEALRLLDEYDQIRVKRLHSLRNDIEEGINSGKGKKVTADEVINKARANKESGKA